MIPPARFPVQLPRLCPKPQSKKRKQQPRNLQTQQPRRMRKRLPYRRAGAPRPARKAPAPFGHRRGTRHSRPRSCRPHLSDPARSRPSRRRIPRAHPCSPRPFHRRRSPGRPVAQLTRDDACPDAKNPADSNWFHRCPALSRGTGATRPRSGAQDARRSRSPEDETSSRLGSMVAV